MDKPGQLAQHPLMQMEVEVEVEEGQVMQLLEEDVEEDLEEGEEKEEIQLQHNALKEEHMEALLVKYCLLVQVVVVKQVIQVEL